MIPAITTRNCDEMLLWNLICLPGLLALLLGLLVVPQVVIRLHTGSHEILRGSDMAARLLPKEMGGSMFFLGGCSLMTVMDEPMPRQTVKAGFIAGQLGTHGAREGYFCQFT